MGKTSFTCFIPLCGSKYTEEGGAVHFFKFPLDPVRKQSWIEILTKTFPNINITRNSRICQQHFTNSNFTSTLKCKLSKFACPDKMSVECAEENLQQIIQHEVIEIVPSPSTSQENQPKTLQNPILSIEPLTPQPHPRCKHFYCIDVSFICLFKIK